MLNSDSRALSSAIFSPFFIADSTLNKEKIKDAFCYIYSSGITSLPVSVDKSVLLSFPTEASHALLLVGDKGVILRSLDCVNFLHTNMRNNGEFANNQEIIGSMKPSNCFLFELFEFQIN